ncbi:DUF72 domain-containing protein [Microbacterium stercoris]|uniref:DUF72 domain-containing protein n=1 Tax=Microbacterium stercoris TaxID=2820289 RepID=A0A939TV28_9MICO|nr:DUF72 domain-containing protein [Microbacterium stercoris]MBO3664664.1 DUF72 domain-containing protein [Microbacterium stercoris]
MSGQSARGRVWVGVSGWRYPSWRGDFYPRGLVQRRELEYIGTQMPSAEINGSFYSLQRPSSYVHWAEAVPDGFVFAVKGPRYITHMLRLRSAGTALANFFASGPLALGRKLGPILWQLPARHPFEPAVLDAFLASLPRTTGAALEIARGHDQRMEGRTWLADDEGDRPLRHSLEPRSESFADPVFADILREHDVSLTVADTAGTFPLFDEVTASDHVYVRLHGSQELYLSGYTDEELDEWAARIQAWTDGSGCPDGRPRDVYVYFDNDGRGRAPHDAVALAARLPLTGA